MENQNLFPRYLATSIIFISQFIFIWYFLWSYMTCVVVHASWNWPKLFFISSWFCFWNVLYLNISAIWDTWDVLWEHTISFSDHFYVLWSVRILCIIRIPSRIKHINLSIENIWIHLESGQSCWMITHTSAKKWKLHNVRRLLTLICLSSENWRFNYNYHDDTI